MSTIVISDPSTSLAVDQSHFTLRSNGRRIGRIPPPMIDRLIVHHGVEVSRKALDRLATLGIPVTFLTREGRVSARLSPTWRLDCAPRIEQSRIWLDPEKRLRFAARIVDAKIANAAAVLRRHAGNHPDPELSEAAGELREIRPRLAEVGSTDELMGLEGTAGHRYFGVFRRMLRAPWAEFPGRRRRPPTDPVNATLSYCYAALQHEILALVEAAGLDPAIGYLHSVKTTRANLSLDLMEPFRPLLGDRLALRLINLGTLKPGNFQSSASQPAIRIDLEGRLAILKEANEWTRAADDSYGPGLRSPKGLLIAEVDRYAKLAHEGGLDRFVPHYLDPKDAPPVPDRSEGA